MPDDKEELALTLGGKRKKLKREHFERLGEDLGLTKKQVEAAFKRMTRNKSKALSLIKISFLSDDMKTDYRNLLISRYEQLDLD